MLAIDRLVRPLACAFAHMRHRMPPDLDGPPTDQRHAGTPLPALGEYVGRARYKPRTQHDLKLELRQAIGSFVDLKFAGVAGPDEPFAGQRIFQESERRILCSSWVPEQDVDFVVRS